MRPYAEHLITKAKKGGVHRQRKVVGRIHDQGVASKLFTEIGPRFKDRPGGYTRVIKRHERRLGVNELREKRQVEKRLGRTL